MSDSRTTLEEDKNAVLRALKWMRMYEIQHNVFGDDVVGKAEKAFERIHELAWKYEDLGK